jgi:hypothetical protein
VIKQIKKLITRYFFNKAGQSFFLKNQRCHIFTNELSIITELFLKVDIGNETHDKGWHG